MLVIELGQTEQQIRLLGIGVVGDVDEPLVLLDLDVGDRLDLLADSAEDVVGRDGRLLLLVLLFLDGLGQRRLSRGDLRLFLGELAGRARIGRRQRERRDEHARNDPLHVVYRPHLLATRNR